MQKILVKILVITLILLYCNIILQTENIKSNNNTIYVDIKNTQGPWDGTKEHPYKKIQEGIDEAINNSTVYVLNGTYHENILMNKTIYLFGNNKTNTIIDGDDKNNCVMININKITIQGFTITNSTKGININKSSNSTITDNTISNTEYGIYIDKQSNNNSIYKNNFLTNAIHAYDNGTNIWNNLYYPEGNYWDTYNGTDTNNDGIGEKPFNITGGDNQDIYPLIKPITQFPTASFTYSPVIPTTQDIIQFTDTSVDPDGSIVKWIWNFGDNNISTIQHPKHKYSDNGIYTITLQVTDNYGAVAKKIYQIKISNVAPTPNFIYLPETPTDLDLINFTDKSQDTDGTIVYWQWDFGDGNTSNEKNPTHHYLENGTYTIILSIIDDDEAIQKTTKQILIRNVAPVALFNYLPNNPTNNDTITFNDFSQDYDGTIISWNWDFGDGQKSDKKSFEHKYQNEGTYTVTLTVVDNDGEYQTIKKNVVVFSSISKNGYGIESFFIYIVYLALFIIMIGVVMYLKRRYQ